MELKHTKIEIPKNPVVLVFQDDSRVTLGVGVLQEIVFEWLKSGEQSLTLKGDVSEAITP